MGGVKTLGVSIHTEVSQSRKSLNLPTDLKANTGPIP